MNRPGFAGDTKQGEDCVMGNQKRHPAEVKELAVRLVFEQQNEYESQWSAIKSVSSKIGCTGETLRT